jgi:hypothetical protein
MGEDEAGGSPAVAPEGRRGLRKPTVGVLLSLSVFLALLLAGLSLGVYPSVNFWPALATGFGASLGAFVLALEWESQRARAEARRAADEANNARTTEAEKRLRALGRELGRNQTSIIQLAEELPDRTAGVVDDFLYPELLAGAWASSGERLGDLLADYEFIADLARFYDQLEDLRWRIRHRTSRRDSYLDAMTRNLATTMKKDVSWLIHRTDEYAGDPAKVLGVIHPLVALQRDLPVPQPLFSKRRGASGSSP